MKKNNKKVKKVQNIIVFAGLSAVVLLVSTFAWFIGRQEVGVNSFNIEVAAIEHLELSLNGTEWSDTISITNGAWTAFEAGNASSVYNGHTNSWGAGLEPVSTAAGIDTDSSRIEIFENSSFTRTPGGFKVLSEQIDNSTNEAGDYVVFDLFVKNSSGTQYLQGYNPTEEEEIFLTYNSAAVVDAAGGTVDATHMASGIENSIRVAFMQIGRVAGTTTDGSTITGMTCTSTAADGITPICLANRNTIWEPNDTVHNANSLEWYTDNCNARVGGDTADLLNATSYDLTGACTAFENGTAYNTNVIHTAIPETASVDIYDGVNGATPNATYVSQLDTFTDSDKDTEGDARNPFMFLAPNSITKIRVYIYLEGMDYDNHDLAEVEDAEVKLNFGFTKQQYETSTDFGGSSLDNGYPTI